MSVSAALARNPQQLYALGQKSTCVIAYCGVSVLEPSGAPHQHLYLMCESQQTEEDIEAGNTPKTESIKDLIAFHHVCVLERDRQRGRLHGKCLLRDLCSQCGAWITTGSKLKVFTSWLLVYTLKTLRSRALSHPQAFCGGTGVGARKHTEYTDLNSNCNLPIHSVLSKLSLFFCVGLRIPISQLRSPDFLSPLVLLLWSTQSLCSVQGT